MKKLPAVQLNLLLPFVEPLLAEAGTIEAVFEAQDLLPPAVNDPDAFVPAPVMYALVEALCETSGDPFFASRVGESMNPLSWPPLAKACQTAATVHEMLILFARTAQNSASSATHGIEVLPMRSRLFERRLSNFGVTPRHNDAFSVAYLLAMIRPIVGNLWRGESVVVKLCDPDVLPARYLGCRVAKTDELGISIEFPTEWLLLPVQVSSSQKLGTALRSPESSPALDTLQDVRRVLRAYLREGELSQAKIAGKFGVSPSTLKRQL
jgi:hypothetical protein